MKPAKQRVRAVLRIVGWKSKPASSQLQLFFFVF